MSNKLIIIGGAALMIIFLGAGGYIIHIVLSEDSPRKRSRVATVTLVRPSPMTVKEKPPEPEPPKEIRRKPEIIEREQGEVIDSGRVKEPQYADKDNTPARNVPGPANPPAGEVSDNTPAGDRLGLDTEGTAGSDAFGLVARKGGRSILAGSGPGTGGGSGTGTSGGSGSGKVGGSGPVKIGRGGFEKVSLLNKFSWYTQIVKTEVSQKVKKQLDEYSGIPRGKFQAIVRISVDSTGAVVQWEIIGSSGNQKMDEVVKQSIGNIRISEPPPEGMPRTMIIKVTSQS